MFEDKPSRGSPDVGSPLFSMGDNALLVKSPLRDGDSGFFMVSITHIYCIHVYVNIHDVTRNTVLITKCAVCYYQKTTYEAS